MVGSRRQKVFKGLESLRDICNAKSNMAIGKGKVAWAGYANAADDAIALLKEQEEEIERQKRPDCEHANHDGAGCLGYCGCEQDDEPIDACKQCEKYTGNISAEY